MIEDLAFAALRIACLSGAVMLGLRVLRIRQNQILLSVWTGVLLASLAMPALQHLMSITAYLPLGPTASLFDFAQPDAATADLIAPSAPTLMSARSSVPDWWQLASLGYVLILTVMLGRLAVGLVLSLQLLHASRPIAAPWTSGQRVRENSIIRAPATVGNSILLPSDYTAWSAETLRAVIAHEASHLANADYYILALSQLNRAIFWFNPLSWWLHRRLTSLAELAGDDAAIAALVDRSGYATILLDMAKRSCPVDGAVAMARPSTIRQRIERALALTEMPHPATRFKRFASMFGVVPLACVTAISVAAAVPPDQAAVGQQPEPHNAITIDQLLDAYAGFYKNKKTGSLMVVTREGDHLLTSRAPDSPVAQYPYTNRDFFLTVVPQQNRFVTDASGAPVRVIHRQTGRTETLERISQEDGQRELAAINKRLADQRAPRVEISIDPSLLDRYVGAYQLGPRRIFTITRDGDKLLARLTGQNTHQVHPYTDRDFFYTIVAAQLSFVVKSDGTATALILRQNGLDRTAERVDPKLAMALDMKLEQERQPRAVTAIDPQMIGRYAGRYLNDSMEITATREGGQLFVQVTGFGRYPVYPYSDHGFFATIRPTQFTFVTDATGRSTQMIRHQNGADDILKRVN